MAGQIRLLCPDQGATRNRMAFMAVLDETARGFVAAPYGRFSEPAFEGEALTGREAACLRVLCVWNAVELPRPRLERSWFVDEMSAQERDDARLLQRFLRGGVALTPDLAARCGPPLRHPADPRMAYREQERSFTAELLRDRTADGSAATVTLPWPEAEEGLAALKAAEEGAPYGATLSFAVPARELYLKLTALAGGDVCALAVTDSEGRVSAGLDGCRVQGSSGRMSRPITGGKTLVAGETIYGAFTLLTETGEVLPIRTCW